nr:hypothetical protein CFP56_04186 [Quercus suber]
MFATRSNNENVIYDQQTAAAAKPLNQGVKGLTSKTPARKAVHKIAFNDENATFQSKGAGRSINPNGADGKDDQADKTGPRNRAPLGNKTTNAKATAFQTPGIYNKEKDSARGASPRLHRAKVKVQVDPLSVREDEEERDIEYMPPREVPLPDHPDDWPADRTYQQFEGRNLTRGWTAINQPCKDEDAEDLSDLDTKLKKFEEREKNKRAQAKHTFLETKGAQKSGQDTLVSVNKALGLDPRGAALALSSNGTTRRYASPTISTKSRGPSVLAEKRTMGVTSRLGHVQHTAAKVASNTTLGYSKGRAVSANTRRPLSDIHREPSANNGTSKFSPMKMPFGTGSTLDELLGLASVDDDDNDDDDDDDDADTLIGSTPAIDVLDDAFVDFQLPPV